MVSLRRVVGALLIVVASALCVMYASAPEKTVDMLQASSLAAQVQLQEFRTSVAALFDNSEAMAMHFDAANVKVTALAISTSQAASELFALTVVRTQTMTSPVASKFNEHLEYLLAVPFKELASGFVASSLETAEKLKAQVYVHGHDLWSWLHSEAPVELLTQAKAWFHAATTLQRCYLAGAIVFCTTWLYLAVTIALNGLCRGVACLCSLCSRRRNEVPAAPVSFGAPKLDVQPQAVRTTAPLQERVSQTTRRRRNESPAPAMSRSQDENAQPLSENLHLLSQLNSATSEELKEIPGLGDRTISKLVSWREKNGELSSVEDLLSKVGMHRTSYNNLARMQGA